MDADFFNAYLTYTDGGETPAFFRRWAAISAIGTWMGRQVYCKFGNAKLYTNLYVMLIGNAGTKKSTAIKTAKRLLREAGYSNFAPSKVSKEKFLMDLGQQEGETASGNVLDMNLWGAGSDSDIRETWICADEFNEFFANNILEFCSTLGDLWDYEGPPYENRTKSGQNVVIPNPTINILGGNTPTAFATAFPPEIVGQGFFSRLLVVHAKPTGLKITWPKQVDEQDTAELVERLLAIKSYHYGEITFTDPAKVLIDKIYKNWKPIGDVRYEAYGGRRLTHLLKLALIHAVARMSKEIDAEDVIRANTTLHHAEQFMPEAFGEFGASKNSAQIHKIMQVLEQDPGQTTAQLWSHVQTDFDKLDSFVATLAGMSHAGKLQTYGDKIYPVKKVVEEMHTELVEYDWLTKEEFGR